MLEECVKYGFSEMTNRGELPPKRRPYAFDNGAYKDWRAEKPFDAVRYEKDLKKLESMELPEFMVAPDLHSRS